MLKFQDISTISNISDIDITMNYFMVEGKYKFSISDDILYYIIDTLNKKIYWDILFTCPDTNNEIEKQIVKNTDPVLIADFLLRNNL